MKLLQRTSKIVALLLLTAAHAYAQHTLKARINNVSTGEVYLWNTTSNQVDTLQIENHSFVYRTALPEPTLFYLIFKGFNDWNSPFRIILSQKSTSMMIDELVASREGTWQSKYPNKSTFTSDPNLNKQLFEFEAAWKAFSDSVITLTPNADGADTSLEKRKQLYMNFIGLSDQLVKNHSGEIMPAVAVFEYLIKNRLIDVTKARELYSQLHDVVKYSAAGLKIGTHINKELSIEIGKPAPYFSFKDSKGDVHDISEFNNKFVLLHFWSSTCGPCRSGNKRISELRKTHSDLIIINVSLDTNESQWRKAIQKDGLTAMLNTCDLRGINNKIAVDYYVHGIPTHYLIDKDGRIVGKGSLDEVMKKF